jgi:ribA/ribD-fused uncharacterized protein
MVSIHAGSVADAPVLFYENAHYALSNFASFAVCWRGRLAMTLEHHYQASKFTDPDIIEQIYRARSAHDAKRIAHEHEDKVRPDWNDEFKLQIMEELCSTKLEQHAFVEETLRNTHDREIIEDSAKDAFWGWGPNKDGQKHLGRIWVKLRSKLPPA